MADTGDIVALNEEQLKKLALLLRNQEEPLMSQVVKSEVERVKYIKIVNDSYKGTISLLDDSSEMNTKYGAEGGAKADIAQDAFDFILHGLNFSMSSIRNCCLRVDCIDKIREHYGSVVSKLAELDPDDVPGVQQLAEEMKKVKDAMKEYCNNTRSASSRALSKAYSMAMKQEGIKFPQLIEKHKVKLGYEGEFEQLSDAQKLEVYNSIINESGRATMPALEVLSSAAGVALLAVAASLMVWDIFTAEDKLETVIHDSVNVLADVGAFYVQVAVEAAVTEAVADLELGVFLVSLAGFVAGTGAGLLFVATAGVLIDLIMGTGGAQAPPVTDLKFHTATMPDGMALAYIIVHDG